MNFKKNLKSIPLTNKVLKNRYNFSKWMYDMHEHINKMLGKKSGLTYSAVRDRYEHFRARCLNKPEEHKSKIEKTKSLLNFMIH